MLRHSIVDNAIIGTNTCRHARCANYAPPHVPFHHRLHRVLHTRHHPAGVHRHELVVSRQVYVEHALHARVGRSTNARIAEHDVEASVLIDCRVYQRSHLFLVADIAMNIAAYVGADRCSDALAHFVLDVRDNDGSCAVGGEMASRTNTCRHARCANYAPPHVPFHHRLHRVLHTRHHPAGVHRHELVVSRQVYVEHALHARVGRSTNARIAEHDVEASVLIDCRVYQRSHLFLVADIAMNIAAYVGADRCSDALAHFVLDVRDNDGSCAVGGEMASRGFAYAACSASDYGHLAFELVLWRCGVCHFVCLRKSDLKENDKVIWTASPSGEFSIAATRNHLRSKKSEAPRWKLIWFSATIPKHNFVE
ncbi:hypothetical protein CFP56_007167 [Quercus suber]|uniref:Uncharacterized protein n=1 Tax=Quercus suber TaxID=58331 RepID=A0AAW0L6V1_QUESU